MLHLRQQQELVDSQLIGGGDMKRSFCWGAFALVLTSRSLAFNQAPTLLRSSSGRRLEQQQSRQVHAVHQHQVGRRCRSSLQLSTTVAPPPPTQVREWEREGESEPRTSQGNDIESNIVVVQDSSYKAVTLLLLYRFNLL